MKTILNPFRRPVANRASRRAGRVRPTVEQLEARDVPTGTGFLQGRAYLDSNGNGLVDPSVDLPHAGATIQLYVRDAAGSVTFPDLGTSVKFKSVGSDTTGADGEYLFEGLDPGQYRIVDATAGYQTVAAAAAPGSGLYAPVVTADKAVDVTVVDQVQVATSARPADAELLTLTIPTSSGGTEVATGYVHQFQLTVTGGGLGSAASFGSFCVDLTQDISPPSTFAASAQPLAGSVPNNPGRIAYLYNHYGTAGVPVPAGFTTPTTAAARAAALQVAIWELEYDPVPNLASGNFRFQAAANPSNPDAGTIQSLAQSFLNESAGKNERAVFLRAGQSTAGGMQSMLATGAFDFASVPVDASVAITPSAVNEVGDQHVFTITVTAVPNGAGTPTFATPTVTFGGAQPATVGPVTPVSVVGNVAEYTVTINSPTAGTFTINAAATVTIGGASLVRDTDPATLSIGAGPDGSGPAVKTYVDAAVSLTPPAATNEVNQSHVFQAEVLQNTGDGAGFVAAPDGTPVTFTITDTKGTATTEDDTTTTTSGVTAGGTASTTVNSPSATTLVVNASAAVVVGGLTLVRDTNPATPAAAGPGGSGPATKAYVDARIVLSPLTAVNATDNPHTVTATVQQDDGLPAGAPGGDAVTGFGPAPDGTLVTFSLANDGGATAAFVGGNTALVSGGAASVTINSPTAGTVTLNGATTFSVGGVSLTRDTNPGTAALAGPGGSGPATKIYVTAKIDIEKYVKLGETGGLGGEGLTPGFWKNHSEYGPAPLAGWPQTHYDPDDSYNAVFGVSVPGSPTLLQALGTGGGGVNALLRHSTAALLNADNPDVDYAYTVAEVIAKTKAAIDSGDPALIEATKNQFAAENEKGADLTPTGTLLMTPAAGFGDDADLPPGPTFPVGGQAVFTYVVTNPGTVPLANVVVTDSRIPILTPVLADATHNVGDDNLDGRLDPGEVWLYTATEVVTAGQHTNTGTVVGTPVDTTGTPIGVPVTDADDANYTAGGTTPVGQIDVEKYVKPVPQAVGGEGLTPGYWKQPQHFSSWVGYTQSQSYNAVFGVADPDSPTLLGALSRGGGGYKALGRHATAALLNAANPNVDYAFTTAQIVALVQNAYATGNYEAAKNLLAAENEKGADLSSGGPTDTTTGYGSDADTPTGPVVLSGSTVTFTYVVTNPGQAPLANVVVTDDNETPGDAADDFHPTPVLTDATHNVGDDNKNGLLDPGEVWLYAYSKAVVDGQHTNVATSVGVPVDAAGAPIGGPVSDADAANWLGYSVGSIGDFVWEDLDGNGIQGDDEPGVNGVTVNLLGAGGAVLDTTVTATVAGQPGYYLFEDLPQGTYSVQFVLPAGSGYLFTRQDQGVTDAADSDADPTTGRTGTYALGTNESVLTVDAGVYKLGSIGGTKYKDLTGDGITADDAPQAGVTVYLDLNGSGQPDAGEPTATTGADGTYGFPGLVPGHYTVREVVPDGFVQTAPLLGYHDVVLTSGAGVAGRDFANHKPASTGGTGSISGYKFFDANANGVWEPAAGEGGLADWVIYVDTDGDGVLDAGEPSATTNAQGAYTIGNLPAGPHTVREVIRNGWIRTTADLQVTVVAGQTTADVNFGNFQQHLLTAGQTATIGFWQNKNGQAVIKSLNGGPTSTALGNWLAASLPNMYGTSAGANNMTGKTNAQVAAYFVTLFNTKGQKLEAQVLATALAVYVTDTDLAGLASAATSRKFGFVVDTVGTSAALYNIGANGAAFGVANNSQLTVWQILDATNLRARNGVLWGQTLNPASVYYAPQLYQTYRNMGNIVYTGINEGGDIR